MAEEFVRTIAGRDITFRPAKPAQMTAFYRVRNRQIQELEKLRGAESTTETLVAIHDLYERFEQNELDLFTSLLVDKNDMEFLDGVMVRGELTLADLVGSLFGNTEEAPDDVEPAPKQPKKAAKQGKLPKTANVRRVQK